MPNCHQINKLNSKLKELELEKKDDKDFKEFEENLKNKSLITNIKFFEVSSINEIFDIIFVD